MLKLISLFMTSMMLVSFSKRVWSEDSIDDQNSKYLKTLPPMNKETRKWFIPSQRGSWPNWASYTLKEYVRVPILYDEKRKNNFIDLYTNNKFLENDKLSITYERFSYNSSLALKNKDKLLCLFKKQTEEVKTKKWVTCRQHKCKEHQSDVEKVIKLTEWESVRWVDANNSTKVCPYSLAGGFESIEGVSNFSYAFIPEEVNLEKNYASVKVGKKMYYVNLKVCSEDPGLCEIHFGATKKTLSDYEKDWIQLQSEYEKSKVNMGKFFDRIEKEGVKREFVDDAIKSEAEFEFYIIGLYFNKVPEKLDPDFVKEVKACAKNRKPVGMDSKWRMMFFKGDKKVCSVSLGVEEFSIVWVDYSEAFMERLGGVVKLP